MKKVGADQNGHNTKQPRHSSVDKSYLPTPPTHHQSGTDESVDNPSDSPDKGCSQMSIVAEQQQDCSALGDTQALSQFVYPPRAFADEVEDEAAEGVWGYLFRLDSKVHDVLVLRRRENCGDEQGPPGGYLIGRHPECDVVIDIPTISNRHFLIFTEYKNRDAVAVLEDLSSNGTFVNDALVGRNNHRELGDGDDVTILNEARFVFRYPRTRATNDFDQQYHILQQLGSGHFATVYFCAERSTGIQYAVKVFEKRPVPSDSQKSNNESLQQEIALLMSVNHPNLLCLKETFNESNAVYLVTELAREGELFNLIASRQKLSEDESRHVFKQLFEGLGYLHDRGIVHRDIKLENILLVDKRLNVKLGDFGLSKIIGEESFTTTLCGTPIYVAPEILQVTDRRKYTKTVDVWSLGVSLYISLCGFVPFSEELCTDDYPYNLPQQIKMGLFDYPSPYWDSVGDTALDLIDKMLTVDVNRRITVDECLQHPWLTGVSDSRDNLSNALDKLDFSKRRKLERQRTFISSINDIRFSERQEGSSAPVKVFHENHAGKKKHNRPAKDIPPKSQDSQDSADP